MLKKKNKKQENLWEPETAIEKRRRHLLDIGDIRYFLKRIILIIGFVIIFFKGIFGVFPMNNDDMKPKINAGDVLFYYRWDKAFVSRDLILYEVDGRKKVGRVVARPGDTISIAQTGGVEVNGYQIFEEDIVYNTYPYEEQVAYPLALKDDEFFIMADFREGGRDSRFYGPIKKSAIKGKIVAVVRWINL